MLDSDYGSDTDSDEPMDSDEHSSENENNTNIKVCIYFLAYFGGNSNTTSQAENSQFEEDRISLRPGIQYGSENKPPSIGGSSASDSDPPSSDDDSLTSDLPDHAFQEDDSLSDNLSLSELYEELEAMLGPENETALWNIRTFVHHNQVRSDLQSIYRKQYSYRRRS
jgi:hypothetical protein